MDSNLFAPVWAAYDAWVFLHCRAEDEEYAGLFRDLILNDPLRAKALENLEEHWDPALPFPAAAVLALMGMDAVHLTPQLTEKVALKTSSSDQTHTLFVGIAYLDGTGVPANRFKAVLLISKAANGGLAEAAECLMNLYHAGVEVRQSNRRTVKWWGKLALLRQERWEREGRSDQGVKALRTYWELSWFLSKLGAWKEARLSLDKALALAGPVMAQEPEAELCYGLMGDVMINLGYVPIDAKKAPAAADYCDKAMALADALRGGKDYVPQDPERAADLAYAFIRVGSVRFLADEYEEAEEDFQRAVDLVLPHAKGKNAWRQKLILGTAYRNLSDADLHLYGDDTAVRFAEKAVKLLEPLSRTHKDIDITRQYAAALFSLGEAQTSRGLPAEGAAELKAAFQLYDDILRSGQAPVHPELIQCACSLFEACVTLDEEDQPLGYLRRALEAAEEALTTGASMDKEAATFAVTMLRYEVGRRLDPPDRALLESAEELVDELCVGHPDNRGYLDLWRDIENELAQIDDD